MTCQMNGNNCAEANLHRLWYTNQFLSSLICKFIFIFTVPFWFEPRVTMLFKRMKTTEYMLSTDMRYLKFWTLTSREILDYKMLRKFGVSIQMLYLNLLKGKLNSKYFLLPPTHAIIFCFLNFVDLVFYKNAIWFPKIL